LTVQKAVGRKIYTLSNFIIVKAKSKIRGDSQEKRYHILRRLPTGGLFSF